MTPGTSRWLYGPASDLLLGCGLVYAIVFTALSLAGESVREVMPATIAIIPITILASAHYGATAMRAYGRAADRRAWMLFSGWTTLLLGAGFASGLYWEALGSWFVTLYLTWSPWHYAGQNFGVAMMFLRRRGVDVTPRARQFLHYSFILSCLLALLALHGEDPAASYAPNQIPGDVYAFVALGPLAGIPAGASSWLMAAVGALYAVVTAAAVVQLRRAAPLRELLPAILLIGTQSLWFAVPALAREFGVLGGVEPLGTTHAHYAFLWIGAGHAVQYLWITSYFASAQGRARRLPAFLLKALLAGCALWAVPAVLFAPGMLGRLPYDEGLTVMVASLVNLHHFVLDGVIWKLREGRIARILLVPRSAAAAEAPTLPPVTVRAFLWLGGAAALALTVFAAVEPEVGFRRPLERGDLEAAERADALLERIGQASAERRMRLANAAILRDEPDRALRHLERSIELRPKAWAWVLIGDVHARREQRTRAAEAYDRALALDPDHAVAHFHAGLVALQQNRTEDGVALLQRAQQLAASDPEAPPGLAGTIAAVLAERLPR